MANIKGTDNTNTPTSGGQQEGYIHMIGSAWSCMSLWLKGASKLRERQLLSIVAILEPIQIIFEKCLLTLRLYFPNLGGQIYEDKF